MGRVRFLHFTSAITNIDMSKTSLYLRNNKMYEQQFVGECAAGIPGLITVRAKKAQELKKGRFATPLSNTVVREQDKMHDSPLYTTMATSTLYSAVLELNVCIPPLCLSKTLLLREDGVLFKWGKQCPAVSVEHPMFNALYSIDSPLVQPQCCIFSYGNCTTDPPFELIHYALEE